MIQQAKHDITIYRGDSMVLEMQFHNQDGTTSNPILTPVDLTDIEVSAQCRYKHNDPIEWLTMNPVIVGDPKQGLINITICSTESAGLVDPLLNGPVTGFYDLQFRSKANHQEVLTVVTGAFNVVLDVSRP